MFGILSALGAALMILLPLFFAGIIIDVGLTSIYAHFGWELWPTFTVLGGIIGLIKGLSDEHWRILSMMVFAAAGYVLAWKWMVDGFIFAIIIVAVYSAVEDRFNI